ncbi:MAG: nuclear transport factor 2 family protein [Myxococcota bacterium]|nr:nuclear transport factor 2 family protein [Myxococcota bacterium]
MSLDENKAIVRQLWANVYDRDWKALASLLTDDCWQQDMPAPDEGARGPDNIVERMRIGFDLIDRFDNEEVRIVAEGNDVVIEHRERWHFRTGEVVENRLVSVHELRDGRVSMWCDYWDIQNMISQAPQWWIEKVAEASPRDFT